MLKVSRKKVIKQFGLQRSGTNYAKFLLEKNYWVHVNVNRGGWKSGKYIPALMRPRRDIIVVIKDPYAWFYSAFQIGFGLQKEKRFSVYFEKKAEKLFKNWSRMNNHWFKLKIKQRKVVIHYEELLASPEEETARVAVELDLTRKNVSFMEPRGKMGWGREHTSVSKKPFNPNWYLEHRYLNKYTEKQLVHAAQFIDANLMRKLALAYPKVVGKMW